MVVKGRVDGDVGINNAWPFSAMTSFFYTTDLESKLEKIRSMVYLHMSFSTPYACIVFV